MLSCSFPQYLAGEHRAIQLFCYQLFELYKEIIDSIKETGTTIVMATHDLGQARRLADNILFLYRGRILEKSSVEKFFTAPKNDLAQAFTQGELLWWHRKKLKPPSELKTY